MTIVIVLLSALWIMVHQLGLVEGMDFGAGAYYYADIPDFEKYMTAEYEASLPYWVYVLLFLAWGWLMYRLWVWVDERGTRKNECHRHESAGAQAETH